MNKTANKAMGIFLTVILLITMLPMNLAAAQEGVQDYPNYSYVEVKTDSPIYNLSNEEIGIISKGVIFGTVDQSDNQIFFYLNDELVYVHQSTIEYLDSDYVPGYETADDETSIEMNMEFVTTEEITVYSDSTFETPMTTIHPNQLIKGFESEDNVIIILLSDRVGYIQGPLSTEETPEDETSTSEDEVTEQPSTVPDDLSEENSSSEETVEQPEVSIEEEAADDTSSESDAAIISDDAIAIKEKSGFGSPYFEALNNVAIFDNSTGKLVQVGTLTKGQTYPIVSDYGNWHKIKFGNGYGYVWKESTKPSKGTAIKNLNTGLTNTNERFIALSNLTVYDNTSGQLVPFATILKGESYPIISDIGNWLKIDLAGRIGYVYEPSTKRPFTTKDKYFEVLADNLEIYDNSTGKLVQVGTLTKGQTYPIVSDYGNWHQIKFGNGYGYVWKESTKPSKSSALKNENKGESNSKSTFTTKGSVIVYDNTSGSLVPFAVLSAGVNYPYISSYDANLLKIDVSGRIGYVYKSSVQLASTSYQYTSYPITLQQMVEKQFSLGAQTDKKYDAYIRQDALIMTSEMSGTVNGTWNVRGGAGASYWKLGTISNGTKVTILGQEKGNDGHVWYRIKYNKSWVNASMEDIRYYVNPNNFAQGTQGYFQFLDLSKPAGVNVTEINQKVLNNKGILTGKAQSFITAASTYNINEIYLIAHALLETGNGSSSLAQGVTISSVNGQAVAPRVVYNMYGIGAIDASPLKSGSEYAYKQGWFTPEAAIIGGAKFIAEKYINHPTHKQNTLYKMRWNPANPGVHQYATDIGWAYKQVSNISKLYSLIDTYTLHFDVPKYK